MGNEHLAFSKNCENQLNLFFKKYVKNKDSLVFDDGSTIEYFAHILFYFVCYPHIRSKEFVRYINFLKSESNGITLDGCQSLFLGVFKIYYAYPFLSNNLLSLKPEEKQILIECLEGKSAKKALKDHFLISKKEAGYFSDPRISKIMINFDKDILVRSIALVKLLALQDQFGKDDKGLLEVILSHSERFKEDAYRFYHRLSFWLAAYKFILMAKPRPITHMCKSISAFFDENDHEHPRFFRNYSKITDIENIENNRVFLEFTSTGNRVHQGRRRNANVQFAVNSPYRRDTRSQQDYYEHQLRLEQERIDTLERLREENAELLSDETRREELQQYLIQQNEWWANIPDIETVITRPSQIELIKKSRPPQMVRSIDKWLPNNWEYTYEGHFYKFEELNTIQKLKTEATKMSHCVDTFWARCVRNDIRIYSLKKRTPFSSSFKRCLTIEVHKNKKVVQVRGKANREASETEREIIGLWAQEVKYKVQASTYRYLH